MLFVHDYWLNNFNLSYFMRNSTQHTLDKYNAMQDMQIIMHTLYTSLVLIFLVSFNETWNFQIRLIGDGKDVQMSTKQELFEVWA